MMKRYSIFILVFLSVVWQGYALPVDDVELAKKRLEKERTALLNQLKQNTKESKTIIHKMLDLGLWAQAKQEMEHQAALSITDRKLLQVRYLLLNNNFLAAEQLVNEVLETDKNQAEALRYSAVLAIEAWKLQEAVDISQRVLDADPNNEKMAAVLGRAFLLQKKYTQALALAKDLQKKNKNNAQAYLLEADVYFWNQEPAKAEAPLKISLRLNPFNADARFSYGYAIWRRVDARQLHAMAAQWELALAINPLHFSTHWHWGNGHTNLTFADYADQNETVIRAKLSKADSLFSAGGLPNALAVIHQLRAEYPSSVLPIMHEASLLYSNFESTERVGELDKSESLFLDVLNRKKHYGPAHNGLAAVIKSKRIRYLANFDSISRALNQLKLDDLEAFHKVFPDMEYYPGKQVKAMVWNQLFTSVVYFPFLSKQENTFVIPPLHIDLAIAMQSPYFRTNTTFDNRQWMDIRGVGSGAADIGYTERGAYFERNVVLHEYVHLFHGRVLTDAENRKIRALYYHAMENNLTLDYYSQNNESEYFAQTYPAYFEPMKVHPLDFKSMNTSADLKEKDPEMYAFLDELVSKERAYLAGDQKSMASNWSEVYMNLSEKVARKDITLAAHYLDTALLYDPTYQPAYLAYARLKQGQKEFKQAAQFLEKAQQIDPNYAPVYASFASLTNSQYLADRKVAGVKQAQEAFLLKAIALEKDYQTAARLHHQLRTLYVDFNEPENAIRVARDYAEHGPTISTYLRDQVDDAFAFAAAHQAFLGTYESLDALGDLVAQKPQNYAFRGLYSDALYAKGDYEASIENMKTVQRILSSSGNSRPDFDLRIAESLFKLNKTAALSMQLDALLTASSSLDPIMGLRLAKLLFQAGREESASDVFKHLPVQGSLSYESLYRETKERINP